MMLVLVAIVFIFIMTPGLCIKPISFNESKSVGVNLLGNNVTTTYPRRSLSELSLIYYGGPVLTAINVVPVFYNSDVQYQSEIENYYNALISGGDFIAFIDSEYGSSQSGSKVNYGTIESSRNLMMLQSEQSDEQIRAILIDFFSGTRGVLPAPNDNTVYAVYLLCHPNFTHV